MHIHLWLWPDADLIASPRLGCFSDGALTCREFLDMTIWHQNVAFFLSPYTANSALCGRTGV